MDQQINDPALSLAWLWLQLGHGFNPWPGNICMPRCGPKNPHTISFKE